MKKEKLVHLEDLMLWVIISFCENAAELGCPRDKEVDMWIRYLVDEDYEKARDVMSKLSDIMERYGKESEDGKEKKSRKAKKSQKSKKV